MILMSGRWITPRLVQTKRLGSRREHAVELASNTSRATSRRGSTFIETTCAVAMLAMVAAAVLGAFTTMYGAQTRMRNRLGAMELANRLVLQYLDDKDTMPQPGL